MAIQTNKFLPSAKSSSLAIIKKNITLPNAEDLRSSGLDVIKNKVVEIDKLLKSNLLLGKEESKIKRKETEKEKFEKREKKLETRKPKDEIKKPGLNIPGLGIVDVIKRFLFFTALGRFFELTKQFAPQITSFIQKIVPVVDFVETLVGGLFKGVVDFIDFGYKAYDTVRDFTKKIGGESFQKTFDEFSSNLNTFINLAIIAGMASTGGTDFGGRRGGPGGRRGRPGRGGDWRTEGNVIKGKGGFKQAYDNMLKKGNLTKGEQRVVRDYKRLVKAGYHPDSAANQAFFRNRPEWLSGRNVRGGGFSVETAKDYRTAAKGNVVKPKLRLSFGKRIFARVPIIGGLLDFAFSLAMGEPVGRAAAKAVGSTLGSALGTLVPIPFAGTILGGILGDIVGGALYDTLIGSQKPKKKMATGGRVATRSGQRVGAPVTRKIRTRQIVRRLQPQISKPGQDVGGENNIKKLFPDPMRPIDPNVKPNPDVVNPLGTLMEVSKILKEIPFLGGVMGSSIDLAMGQRPDKSYLVDFGGAVGNLIQSAIDDKVGQSINQIIKSTLAMAEGGEVVSRTIGTTENTGQEIGMRIAKLLESSINSRINSVFSKIIEQFEKKPLSSQGPGPLDPSVSGPDVFHGMGAERMWNFFKNKGLSDFAVSGILGNARWESSFNPTARGKGMGPGGSDAIGIFQWGETDRWKDLVNWAKSQNLNPWDYDTQLKFAWYEMQTTEKATIPALQGAVSASDAAEKFRAVYERSAHTEQRRKDAAEGFYQQYKGKTYIPPQTQFPRRPSGTSYKPPKPGLFNAVQYITGDKNHPNFELSGHGMPNNYHDHIAFNSIPDKERAKEALRKANIIIGDEFRAGDPGYHGSNLAIDIPGFQWGGKGGIGNAEYEGSKKVRQVLGLMGGGVVAPNQQKRDMSSLKTKASYESTGQTIYVKTLIVEKPVPMPIGSGLAGLSIPATP